MQKGTLLLTAMMTSANLPMPAPSEPPQRPSEGLLRELTKTHGYTLGRPVHVRITPGGERVLFLRASSTNPVSDLFVHEVSTGQTRRLLSARELLGDRVEKLSAAEKAERERKRIKTAGFTGFEMSKDGDRLVLKLNGQLFVYDFSDARSVRLLLPDGVLLRPKLSPSARKLAFVLDENLHVVELPSELPAQEALPLEPRQLTFDGVETPNGVAEFVAQEEMSRYDGYWWNPGGDRLVYQKNDERALEQFTIADAAHPELPGHRFAYPRPGKDNVDVRLFAVAAAGGEHREIHWDRTAFPYLAKVIWGGELCLLVQSRDQTSQVFLRVDAKTGETRVLFEERDPAWLNIHDTTPRFSADGRSFFWATEEGGAWRLERKFLAPDGLSIVRRQVLVGEQAGFHSLAHIDETRGWVWFHGGQDPAQLHLFRTSLDGAASPTSITTGVGWHEASFSPGGEAVAITSTSLKALPETRIHTLEGGGKLGSGRPLPAEAETPSRTPEVELFEVEGLRAAVLRPEGFDAEASYPVILYVYGGPGVSLVRARMSGWFVPQWLADHGFIVVSVDGRGTPRKGRDFERALKGRFHEVPLEDQIKGLEALARRVPQMDLERVGVYGWSFGGYMAGLSVLRRPDIFKAAVAGAPVVDWLYYDTHYTERYLGIPEDDEDPVYAQGNLLTYAKQLERPLLLVHGIADDNVYFAHTLQLADALFRAGRPFEMLPLVGLTHQISDPDVHEALFEWVVRFLGARLW